MTCHWIVSRLFQHNCYHCGHRQTQLEFPKADICLSAIHGSGRHKANRHCIRRPVSHSTFTFGHSNPEHAARRQKPKPNDLADVGFLKPASYHCVRRRTVQQFLLTLLSLRCCDTRQNRSDDVVDVTHAYDCQL